MIIIIYILIKKYKYKFIRYCVDLIYIIESF